MRLLTVLILASILVGCATIPQGIAPAAKPLVSEEGKTNTYEILGQGEGSASHFSLFSFIPFGRADIDEAIQNAIDPLNGDNLINTHYYVTNTWLLIGHSTEINVKGDVIKYTGSLARNKIQPAQEIKNTDALSTIEKQTVVKQQQPNSIESITTSAVDFFKGSGVNFFKDAQHKVTLGSAVQGFAIDYTLIKPINKFLFYSLGIGYKNVSQDYSYGYGEYRWNYTYDFTVIPITANIGLSGKTFLEKENLSINPYMSVGLAYFPPERWDEIGINLNLGAVYEIPELNGIGIGLEYHYFSGYDGFSNLNLSFVYRP